MCSIAVVFVSALVVFAVLPVNQAMPAPPEITEWPAECEGKSYCSKKPGNYPEDIFETLLKGVVLEIEQNGGVENRSSGVDIQDVASCLPNRFMQQLHLIKDENDKIRLVAQTKTFQIKVQIEECKKPGRTLKSRDLVANLLKTNRVDCFETKVPMEFLVLSLDGTTLESVAPKGGIPSSCSAKLMAGH